MSKRVVITGGSGLVGSALSNYLLEKDFSVALLTRNYPSKKIKEIDYFLWDVEKGFIDEEAISGVDVIVHLAGASVGKKRWTKSRKETILSSRIDSTRLILKILQSDRNKIKKIISASATGFYNQSFYQAPVNENDPAGNSFLSKVCVAWETEMANFTQLGITTIILRIGMVLAKEGGALPKIVKPLKRGLGGVLGNGNQFMPWIHIYDLCRLVDFAIKNDTLGIYNAIASQQTTNKNFVSTLAKTLKKPIFLPNVPSFFLRLILGEMAEMITTGCAVSNQKLLNEGFTFKFDKLEEALENLYAYNYKSSGRLI